MSPSTSMSGAGTMIGSGIMQVVALLLIALIEDPYPIALPLLGAGVALFFVGAVLFGQRSDHSYRDPRLPTYSEDL